MAGSRLRSNLPLDFARGERNKRNLSKRRNHNACLRPAVRQLVMNKQSPVSAKRCPTHPGEMLKEDVLPALRLPVAEAARQLGVSRQTLYKILGGTAPVTPEMAVRLGQWCGNGPSLWLRMQQAFDLWHAERALADKLAGIPSHVVG